MHQLQKFWFGADKNFLTCRTLELALTVACLDSFPLIFFPLFVKELPAVALVLTTASLHHLDDLGQRSVGGQRVFFQKDLVQMVCRVSSSGPQLTRCQPVRSKPERRFDTRVEGNRRHLGSLGNNVSVSERVQRSFS